MKPNRLIYTLALVCLAGTATVYALRSGLSVETAPPVVVETTPRAGAVDVDPNLAEVRVTFSKDMMTDNMWSVVKISDDTFPKLAGEVGYQDARSFVIPVALEPGSTYALWLNYKQNDAFRDVNGSSSIPYFLVFQTRK
ncbi:MAG: hypothetical protein BMS9Abin37_0791 [Acidobacteriota bacterium]|nr:MAG: hypothetical protein BMS9Abin37_0791 [Acidobacteriota bacterium]